MDVLQFEFKLPLQSLNRASFSQDQKRSDSSRTNKVKGLVRQTHDKFSLNKTKEIMNKDSIKLIRLYLNTYLMIPNQFRLQ